MKFRLSTFLIGVTAMLSLFSCDDGKTYAELLKDERKATNAFLAEKTVINEIPEDTIFLAGEDAPFYKIDPDGNVYMQVLEADSKENRPVDDQPVYFRFMRLDLLTWYTTGGVNGGTEFWEGNAENMMADPTFFLYNNYTLTSSAYYGYGLQLPLAYVGVNSKVNVLIKSQYGFSDEISYVVPYLYTVTYYPSMIGGGSN